MVKKKKRSYKSRLKAVRIHNKRPVVVSLGSNEMINMSLVYDDWSIIGGRGEIRQKIVFVGSRTISIASSDNHKSLKETSVWKL